MSSSNEGAKWDVDDVQQSLLDNASFIEDNSLSKAKAFVSAAARWLIMKPANVSGENRTVVLNTVQVEKMKHDAEIFIEQWQGSSVKFLGCNNYRGGA